MLRNCAPKVCRSDLRIAMVGNRNSLLPPAKLTRHFLNLKSATSNSVEYSPTERYCRHLIEDSFCPNTEGIEIKVSDTGFAPRKTGSSGLSVVVKLATGRRVCPMSSN